jgi:hypothetical protein
MREPDREHRLGLEQKSDELDHRIVMVVKPKTHKSSSSKTKETHERGSKRRWSAQVTATSDATHPPEGLFNKDAATIARTLASKKVSPKGVSSGMRMLSFYINRAGKNLPASRLHVLEKAKELLHTRVQRERKKRPGS